MSFLSKSARDRASIGLGAGLAGAGAGAVAGVGVGTGGIDVGAGVGVGGVGVGGGVSIGIGGVRTRENDPARAALPVGSILDLVARGIPRLQLRLIKGGWAPASPEILSKWLKGMVEDVKTRQPRALAPVIQELKEMIENDGDMYMGFNRMFENTAGPVKDYQTMLLVFNKILTEAPYYGPIGPPFYMLLSYAMNTNGGLTAFLAEKLNVQFKKIFDSWSVYLDSFESASVLHDGPQGWFSPEALSVMVDDYNGLSFQQVFKCDPNAPHWGFNSWDNFFVREFNEGIRPLELPDNDNVISASCESVFYNIQKDISERDEFWIKGEPYSLIHMLNNDPSAPSFIGGSVFQGFLEVTGYHRWHSPIAGVVRKIVQVPGTYFVQSPALIGEPDADYPFLQSLSFLTAITTRMLIFIESDNPKIGLVCFIAIGMAEVSSCQASVSTGQRVSRGDEIGMFHFGGSSHCMVFQPQAKIQFDGEYAPDSGVQVKVRSAIGVVQT